MKAHLITIIIAVIPIETPKIEAWAAFPDDFLDRLLAAEKISNESQSQSDEAKDLSSQVQEQTNALH